MYMEGGNCYWSTVHISVAADGLDYAYMQRGNCFWSIVHILVAADWLNYVIHERRVTVISQQCAFQWQQMD